MDKLGKPCLVFIAFKHLRSKLLTPGGKGGDSVFVGVVVGGLGNEKNMNL